jgi:hypothetical protein
MKYIEHESIYTQEYIKLLKRLCFKIGGTFRRTFTNEMMMQWQELLVIVISIVLSNNEDQPIWQYEINGVYSSSSMCNLVNFRGVQPICLPQCGNLKYHLESRCFCG